MRHVRNDAHETVARARFALRNCKTTHMFGAALEDEVGKCARD